MLPDIGARFEERTDCHEERIMSGDIMLKRAKRWVKLLLLCFCPAIVLKIKKRIKKYDELIVQEKNLPVKVHLLRRLWAWRRGFLSESTVLYSLNRDNVHRYLADAPYIFAHPINGMYSTLIDSKLSLYFTLGEFRKYLPIYYFLLVRNEIVPLDGPGRPMPRDSTDAILDLCREKGRLAMKAAAGALGEGFYAIAFDGGNFRLNGKPIEETELRRKCQGLNDYIITEYVQQHPYAESFFPQTTNTLRILTVRDYDAHEPFIACVRQRVGRSCSIPVDNWHMGGMAFAVDVESGEIGRGASFHRNSELIWHERHPQTDVPITGTVVPNWKEIRAKILEMANRLPMVPYMGWDVVVTSEGFKVLEINSLPGLDIVQLHQPVLDDERLRRFYALHIPSLYRSR